VLLCGIRQVFPVVRKHTHLIATNKAADMYGLDLDGCVGAESVLRREFDVVAGIGCRKHVQVVPREHGARVDDLHDIEEESALHVDSVVALSVEEAIPDNGVAFASAEVAAVGGDGTSRRDRVWYGLDDAMVMRRVFAVRRAKSHAGTGVDGDVLKGDSLAVVGGEGVVGVNWWRRTASLPVVTGWVLPGRDTRRVCGRTSRSSEIIETVDVESVAAREAGIGL